MRDMRHFASALIFSLLLAVLLVATPTDAVPGRATKKLRPAEPRPIPGPIPAMEPDFTEAQLNEVLSSRLLKFPKSRVPQLSQHILRLCKRFGFDPLLVLSVIEVESHFRPKVKSPKGALGLMQVQPATANFVIKNLRPMGTTLASGQQDQIDLTDPFINTSIGISYLAWLRDQYRNSSFNLIAAYYIGPGRMNQLLSRKSFEPVQTKKYFHAIQNSVSRLHTKHSRSKFRPRKKLECLIDIHQLGCAREI